MTQTGPYIQPAVPDFVAGFGPQQGDMTSLWTGPLTFFQQRVVFRALQATTTTTLPSSGAFTTIGYDTIVEDPYSGWNASLKEWVPPFTGWYYVTWTVWTGTAPANAILALVLAGHPAGATTQVAGIVLPSTGGAAQAFAFSYATAGVGAIQAQAVLQNSASNVSTISGTSGQESSIEICWLTTG